MERTVLLARHGETDWNRDDRIQGWARVPLNDAGTEQADVLARYLATEHPEIGRIHASDLPRCVETVERIRRVEPFDTLSTVQFDAAWRERNFGVFQGFDAQQFFETYPEYAIADTGVLAVRTEPELGESYQTFDERIVDRWEQFLGTLTARKSLVVTHGGVMRQIIAHLRSYDVVQAIQEIELSNCCVTAVRVDEDGDATLVDDHAVHFFD